MKPAMERLDVTTDELDALLEGVREPLGEAGYQRLKAAIHTLGYVTELLENQEATLASLRRLLCHAATSPDPPRGLAGLSVRKACLSHSLVTPTPFRTLVSGGARRQRDVDFGQSGGRRHSQWVPEACARSATDRDHSHAKPAWTVDMNQSLNPFEIVSQARRKLNSKGRVRALLMRFNGPEMLSAATMRPLGPVMAEAIHRPSSSCSWSSTA